MNRGSSRVSWALLLGGSLLLYLFGNSTGTRMLLAVFLVLPLVSGLLLYLPRQQASAALSMPHHITMGDSAELRLTVFHSSRLPGLLQGSLWCENQLTGERVVLPFSMYLQGGKKHTSVFALRLSHCGAVTVKIENAAMVDILGLFSRRCPLTTNATLYSMPHLQAASVTLAQTADYLQDSERYASNVPGFDPSETLRIREYRPGDPIRQIHWKLSEKTGQVFVRDFGLPIVEQMLVLVELTMISGSTASPEDLDQMLCGLQSVGLELLQQDVAFTLAWADHRNKAIEERRINSSEEFSSAMEELLSCPLSPGNTTVCSDYTARQIQCAHAHVAVFSFYLEPDISVLCHGNRVTALLPQNHMAELDLLQMSVNVCPLAEGELNLEL